MKEWWKARDEFQSGLDARDRIGYHRKRKREAYMAYKRSDSLFYRTGFQENEIKNRGKSAWDFEKMTDEDSRL